MWARYGGDASQVVAACAANAKWGTRHERSPSGLGQVGSAELTYLTNVCRFFYYLP